MGVILTHILQTSVSIIVLYAVYWLFLKRDTFFALNRFYLIGALVFSVIIPFFNFSFSTAETITNIVIFLEAIQITTEKVERSFFTNMDVYETILIVYLTGASLFLIRLIFQLLQLLYFVSRSEKTKLDQFHIIYHKKFYQPFSFFNLIFVNKEKLGDKSFAEVLIHEQAHSQQWHTLDLIFLEILTIFQWFNPIIWLYRSSVKEIHEYLADAKVISSGADKKKYFELLLNQNLGYQINDLTNNFQSSLTKKRMLMMTKTKSKQAAKFKMLTAAPIALLLVFLIACSNSGGANQVATDEETTDQTIYNVVDVMPEFAGGFENLSSFLSENISYPKEIAKEGIQGKVYVTFVIEKDGSVSNAEVLRGVHSSLDAEALRVVQLMNNWKPGYKDGEAVRIKFNLPIQFKLK